ncbi:MAG: tetratricopeptide repeat protein [Pseudomonas sp.]
MALLGEVHRTPTAWESSATTPRPSSGTHARRIAATEKQCSRWQCSKSRAVAGRQIVPGCETSVVLGQAGESRGQNLGLLYLEGQTFPQDLKRAAELFRQAANAGNAEAQYALATFYKEGRGVEKDLVEAGKLLRAAAIADNIDAEVEDAIALYNGTGTTKDVPTAVALLNRAARQNSPIAQNRLAWVLVNGQGAPMDKIEGFNLS